MSLIRADARFIPLADGSVQTCVTSPPYFGLRSYQGLPDSIWGGRDDCAHEWGESFRSAQRLRNGTPGGLNEGKPKVGGHVMLNPETGAFCQICGGWRGQLGLEPQLELYVQHIVEVFREVKRVLRDNGTCWIVMGDSYNAHPGQRTEHDKAGWKQATDRGSCETASRSVSGLKPKDLMMVPARVALALQADGWWLRSEVTLCKRNCMPESCDDRPTQATEKMFLLAKNERYFYDAEAVRVPNVFMDCTW